MADERRWYGLYRLYGRVTPALLAALPAEQAGVQVDDIVCLRVGITSEGFDERFERYANDETEMVWYRFVDHTLTERVDPLGGQPRIAKRRALWLERQEIRRWQPLANDQHNDGRRGRLITELRAARVGPAVNRQPSGSVWWWDVAMFVVWAGPYGGYGLSLILLAVIVAAS